MEVVAEQTLESLNCDTEELEQQNDMYCDSEVSISSQEVSSDHGRILPVLQKIDNLSNKVQILRKDHKDICDEVREMTVDSFPGSKVLNALQGLSVEHELLKKKYLDESNARKRFYNEVIELKGNIRVFCRCRPLNGDEISKGYTSVVDFESSQENELQILGPDSSRKQFKFDHVFRPEHSQEAVFVETLPIVTSVLDGYNVCIFAYGQTGTGKTFTMEGTPENRGVNYRTLQELFKISNKRRNITRYGISVSMLEVYNEKIRDLLVENPEQSSKKLEIKQSAEGSQEVPGLIESRVNGTNEVWELLKRGSRVRSVSSTNANELSSRSHCLVRVSVTGENLINGQRTKSHLWLVDLAGSERVGKIEVEGERLKESQFINKSLSALGDVISALASKSSHIPYRNSKLTHILQSSLGGDCKTLMFVQISPSSVDFGETLCSLNFASRVRGIEHGPARKQTDSSELLKYKQLAEKAKQDEKETKKLQDSFQALQLRFAAREHICRTLQEKVKDLEHQLAEERKARQKQESRALAAVTSQSSAMLVKPPLHNNLAADSKRPPLAPPFSKLRPPLRRISNLLPPPPTPRPSNELSLISFHDKENQHKPSMMTNKAKAKLFLPRRCSVVVKPNQTAQPKRRASIATTATFRRAELNPNMTTPMNRGSSSISRFSSDRPIVRNSFGWDPQRMWRRSSVATPTPAPVESTPVVTRRYGTRFMGSPPSSQVAPGSWKPKYPTVVALQKKQLVWSPLKMRSSMMKRKSFFAS